MRVEFALDGQGVYMTQAHTVLGSTDSSPSLTRRLDNIGWALFFLMTGAVWLVPESQVPAGTWLIGTGLLLLGLNAVRALLHVRASGFGSVLGALALAAGLSAFWGIRLPIAAIGLILLGLGLLGRELLAGHE